MKAYAYSMTTIAEHTEITQGGYRVVVQTATCANCHGRIKRAKPARPGVKVIWGHTVTSRAVCLLPADTSKVATPA